VIRGFEAPGSPFGPGHRGIDIAVPFGTPVLAPAEGVVTFAGWVAGAQFVTIDHGDGIRTTSSWLSDVGVRRGDPVAGGEAVGRSGHGHGEVATPHLHFGVRIHGEYVDPMLLLGPLSVVGLIRLAPLEGSTGR
jgi:murein DD-endopeptidase MepM/ murein hydrolase activator NlpD